MKFKELLGVVSDGAQLKISIIAYDVRFTATYYKKYYKSDLLDLDVQKIEISGDELMVYLK